ncbi:hypothetical protein ACFLTA_09970 [Bacteroidota bacterium]
MTPKQIERIQAKIKQIRSALVAEKREFGAHNDSRGLRYLPPEYYIKIQDYKGGLNYTRWFQKHFPDDIGFPEFLFEWTIILYKLGKLEEAERMVIKTFRGNTYLLDKFFNRPVIKIEKWEGSNWENAEQAELLQYSCNEKSLEDFAEWLSKLEKSDRFLSFKASFINIQKALKDEDVGEKRTLLVEEAEQLIENY